MGNFQFFEESAVGLSLAKQEQILFERESVLNPDYSPTQFDIEEVYGPDASHLDVVQGNSEAQTELYTQVLRGSTGADDAVMHQEFGQAAEFGSEAGQNGGGDWNA